MDSFADIADPARRSAALFSEAGKVLLSPRCVNCHPASDRPLQGDTGRPHEPPVRRGADGHGVPAMRCMTCHTSSNYDAVGMPGHSHWALAPASMAWEGRSLRQICEQIKDPARNGGRKLSAVVEHIAERLARRLGLGARSRARARAGHAGRLRRPDRRLGTDRRLLSGSLRRFTS